MNESKNARKNVSMMLTGMMIGAALTGHHAGETVQVTVPSGVLSLRIEKITR